MRPSVKQLSQMLVEMQIATKPFTAAQVKNGTANQCLSLGFGIFDETYGNNSHVYIRCLSSDVRDAIERYLISRGVTSVNTAYWQGGPVLDVGVGYIKGSRWGA